MRKLATILILFSFLYSSYAKADYSYSIEKVDYKSLVANLYLPESERPPSVVIRKSVVGAL